MLLDFLFSLQILIKRNSMNLDEADCDNRECYRQRQIHRNGCVQLQVEQKESQKSTADHNRSHSK